MQHLTQILLALFLCFVSAAQAQLFPVRVGQQWGLINNQGEMVVKTNYEHIGPLEKQGYYLVQQGGKLGAIDQEGKPTLACSYENLMYLGQDIFTARQEGTWKVINEVGTVLFDSLDASIKLLEGGFFSYQYEEKLGLAHCETGRILPPVYEDFSFIRAGWVEVVDTNGGKQWIDKNGRELMPRTMQEIIWKEEYYVARCNDLWGLYDSAGVCLVPNEWPVQKCWPLGIVEFRSDDKKSLYIVQTKELIQANFERISLHQWSWLRLDYNDGTMGLMDSGGQLLFKVKAETLASIGQGYFKYQEGEYFGILKAYDDFRIPAKYDFIGPFSRDVVLVCKNGRCGVLNKKGEEVLPLTYEGDFTVWDNRARYRPIDKPMQLFSFDENGQLEGQQAFSKIRSLRIVASNNSRRNRAATQNSRNPYQVNDTLCWFFCQSSEQWGLMNTKTQRYKYTPQWAEVYVLPKEGLSIVAEAKKNSGGKQDIGRINLIFNQRLGIFNNERGLPVSPMNFLDVRMTDFTEDSLPVARCIFIGGKHGLINTRGRVVAKDYVYIGKFVDGKARATKKGKLEVDLKEKITPYLSIARPYYKSMLANYSYDQDDGLYYFQEFNRVGRLHCVEPQWGYLDLEGKPLVDFKYEHAERYHRGRALVIRNSKIGLLDEEGGELLPPQYDGFSFLNNTDSSLYIIHEMQQWKGAIDTFGQLIFPTQYVQVGMYHNDRIAVQDTTGRWGFLDRKGQVVVPIEQRRVRAYKEGRAAFFEGHKWGFYNRNGTVSVAAEYLQVGDFSEGKAWVKMPRGQQGYIDCEGNILFQGQYRVLKNFQEGLAVVRVSNKGWGIINTKGKFVVAPKKRYRKITTFNAYGIAKIRIGKRYRLVDREGKWVGKRSFSIVKEFSEGLAAVRVQGNKQTPIFGKKLNWQLIDTMGDFVSKEDYRCIEAFSEGLAKFKNNNGCYGYLNRQGQVAVPATFIKASNFEAGKAVVWSAHNKTGVLDNSGETYMPIIHNKILDYSQGLALLKKTNSGYGFIHDNAKPQTPMIYRAARPFQHQVALVKPQDKWGLINRQGLTVLSDKYDGITDFEAGAATVTINRFWGIVNDKGEVLLAPIYEQIREVGHGLFRVEKANKVGYINNQGQWLWPMQ